MSNPVLFNGVEVTLDNVLTNPRLFRSRVWPPKRSKGCRLTPYRDGWSKGIGGAQMHICGKLIEEAAEFIYSRKFESLRLRRDRAGLSLSADTSTSIRRSHKAFLRWCFSRVDAKRNKMTLDSYGKYCLLLKRFRKSLVGGSKRPVQSLKPADFNHFYHLFDGKSLSYQARHVQAIKRWLSWANKEGHVDLNLIRFGSDWSLPSQSELAEERSKLKRSYEPHEVQQLLRAAVDRSLIADEDPAKTGRRGPRLIELVCACLRDGDEGVQLHDIARYVEQRGYRATTEAGVLAEVSRTLSHYQRRGEVARVSRGVWTLGAIKNAQAAYWEALILTGINCAFLSRDFATLTFDKLDLDGKLDGIPQVNFARGKTGIGRKCPLRPETVAALRYYIEHVRKGIQPARQEWADLVFLGKRGKPVNCVKPRKNPAGDTIGANSEDAIRRSFERLVARSGIPKLKGRGFSGFRTTFSNAAAQAGVTNERGVNIICGWKAARQDDGASSIRWKHYVEQYPIANLVPVVDAVWGYLFNRRPAQSHRQDRAA